MKYINRVTNHLMIVLYVSTLTTIIRASIDRFGSVIWKKTQPKTMYVFLTLEFTPSLCQLNLVLSLNVTFFQHEILLHYQ